jgi:hypothetical protein
LNPTQANEDDRLQLLTQAVDNLAACFEVGLAAFVKEKRGVGRKPGSSQLRSLRMAENIYRRLRDHGAFFPMHGIAARQRFPVEKALEAAVADTNAYADRINKSLKYSKITVEKLRDAVEGKNPNVRRARKMHPRMK